MGEAYSNERRHARQILEDDMEGIRSQGRPRQRWEDNIKMGLEGTVKDVTRWKEIAQDWRRWKSVVKVL